MSRLADIGLDDARRAEFEALDDAATVVLGRVGRVDRGEVVVLTEDDDLRVLSDSQRAQAVVAPVTGDWVTVRDDDELGLVVEHVLERRTSIVRRDPAEQITDQVLVANVDRVAVVHGLDLPANEARIERFLVLAIDSGADPLIILTKQDLANEQDEMAWLDEIAPVIRTSIIDGSGVSDLGEYIADGETLVFIGPSGVGKSSLVNALIGEEIAETADVRESDRRGRHTTTVRELIELPGGGVVIDTPGIRAIGLWAADVALDEVFADIAELAVDCRFRDCTHRSEPGCAVTSAVESGDINSMRLSRYQLLWQELAEQAIELERRKHQPRPQRRNRRRR
jgi:ribosome biogenesis GTPase